MKQARALGIAVIHVQVGFRPGLPEVSPRNMLFRTIKNSAQHQQIFQGAAARSIRWWRPKATTLLTKHRVSAFTGTDLEMILRANGIETLILFGIATSGVVLSTVRHASDADYRLIVVKDCCVDLDADVHACLVDKVFPRQATVVSASELLDSFASTLETLSVSLFHSAFSPTPSAITFVISIPWPPRR